MGAKMSERRIKLSVGDTLEELKLEILGMAINETNPDHAALYFKIAELVDSYKSLSQERKRQIKADFERVGYLHEIEDQMERADSNPNGKGEER